VPARRPQICVSAMTNHPATATKRTTRYRIRPALREYGGASPPKELEPVTTRREVTISAATQTASTHCAVLSMCPSRCYARNSIPYFAAGANTHTLDAVRRSSGRKHDLARSIGPRLVPALRTDRGQDGGFHDSRDGHTSRSACRRPICSLSGRRLHRSISVHCVVPAERRSRSLQPSPVATSVTGVVGR
jgi:hypothetical protein